MTVIDESLTAKGFTPAGSVPLVYGMQRLILGITIHWWGAFGQTHDGVNAFFVNGPGATSAHFVASGYPRKRINCLVSPLDAAWACGNARGNATTISIECRPEASQADYEVVAELVRWIRDTYGLNLPLFPHRYWQSTACPGGWDLAKVDRMAEALRSKPVATTPKTPIAPKPTPKVEDMQIKHDQPVINKAVTLSKGVATWLKGPDNTNWNLATEQLAYYDIEVFLRGKGLGDGESITVQAFIVTKGGRSGFFPVEVHGSADGSFSGSMPLKVPLLSTARLEVLVTSSVSNAVIETYGAQTLAFAVD